MSLFNKVHIIHKTTVSPVITILKNTTFSSAYLEMKPVKCYNKTRGLAFSRQHALKFFFWTYYSDKRRFYAGLKPTFTILNNCIIKLASNNSLSSVQPSPHLHHDQGRTQTNRTRKLTSKAVFAANNLTYYDEINTIRKLHNSKYT